MSTMISIDFGNSFTKVGIRLDHQSMSQHAKDANLLQDDGLNICIPSLVANVSGKKQQWFYGTEVLQLAANTTNMRVFRNWKPLFFRDVEQPLSMPATSPAHPMRQMSAEEVRDFSEKSGIALEELEILLQNRGTVVVKNPAEMPMPVKGGLDLFGNEIEDTPKRQKRVRVNPKIPEMAVTEEVGADDLSEELLIKVGIGYFTWLHKFISPICRKIGIGKVSDTPVRISLPSFGSQNKAEGLLVHILEESGWKPDKNLPAITEPISNSIGIFTKGRNATFRNKKYAGSPECPSNARMFGFYEPGLFQALRERVLEHGLQCYWAMGVDLGGYTADFAMLGFDLDELDMQFDGKYENKNRRARHSEAIGIRTLDSRIRDLLGGKKQAFFQEINEDPDQKRIETFHRFVYDNLKPYDTGKYGVIGAGNEGERLRECIQGFGDEVANYAEKFLVSEQYQHVDALILTGGGCNIPIVRDTICKRLATYRRKSNYAMTYIPSGPNDSLPKGYERLDPLLVRGATALGGASVFFDFATDVI